MSPKILVIDENPAASQLAENVLAQTFSSCDVLFAQTAEEGLGRFHVAQPDLILLNEKLSDMDGETVCYRLLNDPSTAGVPVVVMSTNGHAQVFQNKYRNVVKTLSKPVTAEALKSTITGQLALAPQAAPPHSAILFRDPSKVLYSGHSGFFSLRQALQMAYTDGLTGVFHVFINRSPVDLYISKGRFLFATTRNPLLYMQDSPAILANTNLGTLLESQTHQAATGCPLFLYLAAKNGFPHDDVAQITREHGQRLFANLWTAGRVNFEFEQLAEFPEFARNFPASPEDPDNWVLASLRHVKFSNIPTSQRPDPEGNPAYTRKGYELIQRLKLNDAEARFASSINGADPLQSVAKKIGIPLNDALLIVFRFQILDIIDYWSPKVLRLPGTSAEAK